MRTLFAVALATVVTSCHCVQAAEGWLRHQVLGFEIQFTEENRTEIPAVVKILTDFESSFCSLSGASPALFAGNRIQIFLYPKGHADVSLGHIAMHGGPRMEGERLAYIGSIKMPGPKMYDGQQGSSSGHVMDRNFFDKVLIHEVAPAYLELYARSNNARFHDSVPYWFEQGLEEYFAVFHSTEYWRSRGVDTYHARLRQDTSSIDTDYGLNLRDPYNDGLIILEFLKDEFGEKSIIDLLISKESTFGARMRLVLRIPYEELLVRFNHWRAKRIGIEGKQ